MWPIEGVTEPDEFERFGERTKTTVESLAKEFADFKHYVRIDCTPGGWHRFDKRLEKEPPGSR